MAVLNGGSGKMVGSQVGDTKAVQKIVGAKLFGKAVFRVCRPTLIQSWVDRKGGSIHDNILLLRWCPLLL